MENHSIHLLPYLQLIAITSFYAIAIPWYFHIKNSNSPIIQFLNLIFILSLALSYIAHAALSPWNGGLEVTTMEFRVPSN